MSNKQKTRRAILERLKTGGPQDAAALAEDLGVTAMAVRQHLYDLQQQRLVVATAAPPSVGRPAKLWRLTEAAERYFPDAHADLAVDLIETVRQALGPGAMDALIAARAKRQAAAYVEALAGVEDLEHKLRALAEARTAEGYMARVEQSGDGFLLIESHCPICSAARACTGLCAMELQVFTEVLGPSVSMERTDHILEGASRCAYRIKKAV